jgi:hypothetical protein
MLFYILYWSQRVSGQSPSLFLTKPRAVIQDIVDAVVDNNIEALDDIYAAAHIRSLRLSIS